MDVGYQPDTQAGGIGQKGLAAAADAGKLDPLSCPNEPSQLERECELLGTSYARAKLRLDAGAPNSFAVAYRAYRGPRTRESDYFARKVLSLRFSALKRGMVVDAHVLPKVLRDLVGPSCLVSLEPFSFSSGGPSDPSVDRLYNDGTYALGNLCPFVQRVNRAKGAKTFEEVLALAQCDEDQDGLLAAEWERLASLMYGAWDAFHAAGDPLLLPLATYPGRHMFTTRSQVVQLMMLRSSLAEDGDERLKAWADMTAQAGQPEQLLLKLVDRLRESLRTVTYAPSAWLVAGVFEAFVEWYRACRAVVDTWLDRLRADFHQGTDIAGMVERWSVGDRMPCAL